MLTVLFIVLVWVSYSVLSKTYDIVEFSWRTMSGIIVTVLVGILVVAFVDNKTFDMNLGYRLGKSLWCTTTSSEQGIDRAKDDIWKGCEFINGVVLGVAIIVQFVLEVLRV